MAELVLRRVLVSIPLLLLASVVVFIMVSASADPLAELRQQPEVPESAIEARREALGLDEPVLARYAKWFTHFIQGDFGTSLTGQDVRTLVWDRLQVTLRMVVGAMVVAVGLALAVGVVSAVRQYSWLDHTLTGFGFVFLSMPVFWLAALLKEYVAIPVNDLVGRQVLYTVGEADPNLHGSLVERWANYLGHLALPTGALVLVTYAAWSRYVRSSVLDVLSCDYVRVACAKGLSPVSVIVGHALRNALIPFTTVAALGFGYVLGGAVVAERVFAWQGMGSLLVDAVRASDPNVVLAWLMVSASAVVIFNLLADITYAALDPRVRLV